MIHSILASLKYEYQRRLTQMVLVVFVTGVGGLLAGCATTWQELQNPWLRSESIDFTREGGVMGHVIIQGYEASQWGLHGYLEDLHGNNKETLSQSNEGFFFKVLPGKYKLHILRVTQLVPGYGYYNQVNRVDLNHTSQEFDVNVGEVVYVGDVYVSLGSPEALNLKDVGTLIGMALGASTRNLKIGFGVKDKSYEKLKTLKMHHPDMDYKFITELWKTNS